VGMALIFGLRRQTSTDVAGATDSSAER
jgi:hypothetical protein